jgi:hypothetical protein
VSYVEQAARQAPHRAWVPLEDVGVDLGCALILVAQELLDLPEVMALFEQVDREPVAKRSATDTFGDGRAKAGRLHCALEERLVKVVTSALAGRRRCRAREQTLTIEPPLLPGTIT